jgi:uncharacterized damage-inducible protein DinB
MTVHRFSMLLIATAMAVVAHAQSNPLSADAKRAFNGIKNNVLRSAEKMPEENYSFKPAPTVRSFGELVGHVADYHYIFCGGAKSESRDPVIETTKKSKADLIAALKESMAYCDAIFDAQTDAKAAETVKVESRERTRLAALYQAIAHDNEHYGNMVTYLRIKGLVPPSSEVR